MSEYHEPVLLARVLEYLDPGPGKVIVDATMGGGGHSEALLERLPGGKLIGIDQDYDAHLETATRLSRFSGFVPVRGNFRSLDSLLDGVGVDKVDGILMDLGVSSHQFDTGERGFSFRQDAPLDMRMDQSSGTTAADLVGSLDSDELARIFWEYGEEKYSRRIAGKIVEARMTKAITTTGQLADLIRAAVPAPVRYGRIHPATKCFQALRIALNDEITAIELALAAAAHRLNPGGVIAVISYHSLEDRLVKTTFRRFQGVCTCPALAPVCKCNPQRLLEVLTRHPVIPDEAEIASNPRARSAKLRVARRTD